MLNQMYSMIQLSFICSHNYMSKALGGKLQNLKCVYLWMMGQFPFLYISEYFNSYDALKVLLKYGFYFKIKIFRKSIAESL